MSKKFRKQKKQEVNEEIISSISSPNSWTPDMEDAWNKQPAKELKRRFIPLPKPRHIAKTSKPNYFLEQKERDY